MVSQPWLNAVNLPNLRVFAQVAQFRSFRRAAQALNLSQPAVSDQVRRLERLIGLPLIVRSRGSREVQLTEAGNVVLEHSLAILEHLIVLADRLDGLTRRARRVSVGANLNASAEVLAGVHQYFRQRYPAIALELCVDDTHQLLPRLRSREIELAIVLGPLNIPDLRWIPIADQSVVLVAASGHRLATRGEVPFSELTGERFIIPGRGATVRRAVEALARRHRVHIDVAMEATDVHARIQAALQGLGVAVVPAKTVAPLLEQGLLVEIKAEGFPIPLQRILVHRNEELSPEAQLFISCLPRGRASPA